MQRIRQGDEVIVIAGKDKGRRGNVTRVLPRREGARRELERREETPAAEPASGPARRNHREGAPPRSLSNVMIYNATTEKGDRVGYKRLEDGRKVRFFKSNGEVLDR